MIRYLDVCSEPVLPEAKARPRALGHRCIDITGQKFGYLTVIAVTDDVNRGGERLWLCRCQCGRERTLCGSVLKRGQNRSCGCFRRMRAGRLNFIHGRTRDIEYQMFADARKRARNLGLPFDIELTDVVIPKNCPAIGIPLDRNATRLDDTLPSIDRIVPSLGYVKGNIAIISWRANKLKNNASVEELEGIAKWMRSVQS